MRCSDYFALPIRKKIENGLIVVVILINLVISRRCLQSTTTGLSPLVIFGLICCKLTCDIFPFIVLTCAGVWLLFNCRLGLLFLKCYVIGDFDEFLLRG